MSIRYAEFFTDAVTADRGKRQHCHSVCDSRLQLLPIVSQARETGGTTTWKKYTSLRNQVVHTLRQAKKDHLKKVSGQGSKQFWKTVKFLKKASSQIPTLNNGSIIASTNVDKASVLNEVLSQNFNSTVPPRSN